VVELHTGAYCDAVRDDNPEEASKHLRMLEAGAAQAAGLGLEVHAGHGIDFETVAAIAEIPEVAELNIGHFLIGEAVFTGLSQAIGKMRALMDEARS
jgi:pyridoxine 5-phosphate synthase